MGRWQTTISDTNDIQLQVFYDRTNRTEPNLKLFAILLTPISSSGCSCEAARSNVGPRSPARTCKGRRGRHRSHVRSCFPNGLSADWLPAGRINLIDKHLTLTVGTKALQTNFLHGIGWEPSARLAWTLDEKQTIWAAFTHALRKPSDAEENFYLSSFIGNLNGTPFFARFNANTRFSPEEMNGYELGYRRLLGKHFLVDTASFYNHYHDLFDEEFAGPISAESGEPGVSTPVAPYYLLPAQFGNGLLAYTKGIELSPEWRPAASWRLRGSYSYLT